VQTKHDKFAAKYTYISWIIFKTIMDNNFMESPNITKYMAIALMKMICI